MPGFPVLHYLPEFDPIHGPNFNVYSELCLFSFIIGSRISPTFCLCDQILTYEERLSVSTSRVLYKTLLTMGFPRGSVVKNPPANAGDVSSIPGSGRSPGEMATCPSILAWEIPWTEEPGGLQFMGSQRVGYD